jgi:hypothetical protein
MARKKRKQRVGTRKKKSKAASKKRTAKTRKVRKQPAKSFSKKISSAYHVVVDTIKGTDQLRNKMEPPATSETE